MIQSLAVFILFGIACWFMGKSLYKSWFGPKDACTGCPMAKVHFPDFPDQ